jgi:hypothetical protein
MTHMEVSLRLTRWIKRTFPEGSADPVLGQLRALPAEVIGGQDPERIQASLVICTRGEWHVFQECVALAEADWRDILVCSGLGNADWPACLDSVLGPDHEGG